MIKTPSYELPDECTSSLDVLLKINKKEENAN